MYGPGLLPAGAGLLPSESKLEQLKEQVVDGCDFKVKAGKEKKLGDKKLSDVTASTIQTPKVEKQHLQLHPPRLPPWGPALALWNQGRRDQGRGAAE